MKLWISAEVHAAWMAAVVGAGGGRPRMRLEWIVP
jgi:hypothetical protein